MKRFLFPVAVLFSLAGKAQPVAQFVRQNKAQLLDEYVRFLSIPNVSADTPNIRRNTAFIREMMERRGIRVQLLQGTTPGVTPAVFGEIKTPGATRTLGFYAHYDGQPVNPKQWHEGLAPFEPVVLTAPLESGGKIVGPYKAGDPVDDSYRISGRGSADDKAGVMVILNAYDALVKTGAKLSANIRFLFEGEEEVGSIHLDEIFRRHKDLLTADAWIVVDGPKHITGRKTLSFGVRGDVNMALTVYGARRPLHSGNYGNWAPNPALRLVQLLASLKDENGNVLVKDFYADVTPLSPREKQALAQLPNSDSLLKKELGLKDPEMPGRSLAEGLMVPTLNINGIQSANVGAQASNVIPAKAEAVLDLRLVKGNDWRRQVQKVVDHIKSRGFTVIDHEPTDEERAASAKLVKITMDHGYNAQRTSMDLPIARAVQEAVQSTTNDPLVLVPSAGGSLPLYLFEDVLQSKVMVLSIANYDNNQHAENENVRIGFLWEGIETVAAVMRMK